jgi:C4-dicarboxylate transporter
MKGKVKIFEQGLEEHPKATIILGNLVMMIWIASGTIACWFLHPLIAWIYLAAAIIMVGVVLRKLVCTNCYYYDKRCGLGWGKLAALFFKEGDMEKFSTSIGVKLAPLTYGLLSLIPIVLVVISIVQEFTVPKIIVLAVLLLVSFYSGFLSRKKGCANCKMKLACPGSVS